MTAYHELVAGTDTYVLYKEESTFKTGVTPDTMWGSIDSFRATKSRQLQQIYGVKDTAGGGQQPRRTLKGNYEGTISLSYRPITWGAVKHILGAVSGAGSSGSPYSYTHASKPASLTIGHDLDDTAVDSNRTHKGCLCKSFSVRFQQGQAPVVSQEYFSANIGVTTTLDTNATLATGSEYNFDGGSLELPTSTPISDVIESGTLTITREIKPLYGVGSETAMSYVYGKTTYKLSLTLKRYNDDKLTNFLGSATALSSLSTYASAALKFSNGASKYVYFTFTNLTADEHTDNDTLNEAEGEEITYVAEGLVVTERTS